MSIYHVSPAGLDSNDGSAEYPWATINRAATAAYPGDTVQVHAGTYREWVAPVRGGLSDSRRITFEAAPGEHVIITGSEQIDQWEHVEGDVWRTTIPQSFFGDFNPYAEELIGDWTVDPAGPPRKHLGDVYLNGVSFYEVHQYADLLHPPQRTTIDDHWTAVAQPITNPAQTTLVWYAEVHDDSTSIWANFQGADPRSELVEINVRRSVFYPHRPHLNYITVRGFELAQAACPWTPPTADQPGLIGPHWAKGWIIEDNIIHDAKCSAISLGKEAATGHNFAMERGDKPGYQYQLESVFSARHIGWDKEHIGSHIVRRNTIYNCGQNAIVGHLGCVFSTIEDNHIYQIALKREFYGYEIAGIKLHAAIDVTIRHNNIHDCSLGIWLDWQTQGTRISRNILHHNSRDLFVEVSHGPYLVDHNILASQASIEIFSQGGAYVHNLVCGTVLLEPVVERPTPYHVPHSTQVAGYAAILGGDDRWVGNIFLAGQPTEAYGSTREPRWTPHYGTIGYTGHPTSLAEYIALVGGPERGDHNRFEGIKQPVYLWDNTFGPGAHSMPDEAGARQLSSVEVTVVTQGQSTYLEATLPPEFAEHRIAVTSGADLPRVRFVDAEFEETDGSPAVISTDLLGISKDPTSTYPPGPLAGLAPGTQRTRLW